MCSQLQSYLTTHNYRLVIENKDSSLYKQGKINLLIVKKGIDLLIEFFVSFIGYVISSQRTKYSGMDQFRTCEQQFQTTIIKQSRWESGDLQ